MVAVDVVIVVVVIVDLLGRRDGGNILPLQILMSQQLSRLRLIHRRYRYACSARDSCFEFNVFVRWGGGDLLALKMLATHNTTTLANPH